MVGINDMKMPESCIKCPFSDGHFTGGVMTLVCVTNTGRYMYAPDLINRTDRPDWCPLREVPGNGEQDEPSPLDAMFKESFDALERMERSVNSR